MPQFVVTSEDIVIRAGFSKAVPEGAMKVVHVNPEDTIPEGCVGALMLFELPELTACRVEGGFLLPRERACEVAYEAGEITVSPCPVGTVIEVHDMAGQELMIRHDVEDGLPIVFSLTDPGSYEVWVTPPLPYLETIKRFVIE